MAVIYSKLNQITLQDAFRLALNIRIQPNGCWEWIGRRSPKGYGYIGINTRSQTHKLLVHRMAYRIHYGTDPREMMVCHTCDNPPCCNPAHLFLGTNEDNMRDMFQKGRNPDPADRPADFGARVSAAMLAAGTTQGMNNGSAKLTDDKVKEIRERWKQGGVTRAQLAREYGLKQTAMSRVIDRRSWTHL